MIRGIKILCLAGVVFLCGSCVSPSVISIDSGQKEENTGTSAPNSEPEPTPIPELTPTVGFTECGSDLDCFNNLLETCQESSLHYTQSLDFMGAEVSTTLQFVVTGPVDDQCEFSVITDEVKVSFSEEAVQQLLDSGMNEDEIEAQRLVMEESQAAASFDEVCFGTPIDLIQVFQRWEQGQFSMTDWDPFTCEGKLFSAIEIVPDPTELPPAEEVQPASGGNFLANMSFEANPGSVVPGWYIDAKNTDLAAEWTMEQARDGQYSLLVSATKSANKGFPGWFLVDPVPVDEAAWHVVQVWAMTPDGADAFVSVEFLDANGATISTQGTGCVDLDSDTWNKISFGITEDRLEGVSFLRLGLQQCLSATEGTLTHLYYDEIYIGITPP